MIPEDETSRRGEPVIVISVTGEIVGTIEWGGVTRPASIYSEDQGRIVGVALNDIRSDPGGKRPVWDKIQRLMNQR